MDDGALLTLEEAATRCGYRKRDLRALVRDGRLPAIRAGGHWRVAPADLALLPGRPALPTPAALPTTADSPPTPSTDPVAALIELLRERDRKLAELQDERAQLTGQVGFLLGQLTEREERILVLERGAAVPPTNISMAQPEEPMVLIEERLQVEASYPALGPPNAVTDALPNQSAQTVDGAALSAPLSESVTAVVGSDSATAPSQVNAPAMLITPHPTTRRRRGLFGLFRTREALR
jgi:excisionase family DNA binding protein